MPRSAAAAADPRERRDPRRDCRIPGGARRTDPPLTTRHCADWMGLSLTWVRSAITEGVPKDGKVVQLQAEELKMNGRVHYRIHLDHFVEFLEAIGWKRRPTLPPSLQQR